MVTSKPRDQKPPADYGPIQAPTRLGVAVWQFEAALRCGLVPPADCGGRWSAALIESAAHRLPEVLAVVGDQPPIGANRAAGRIAERLDLEVDRVDIDVLAQRGLLTAAGEYKGWPLYDVRELDTLAGCEAELIATLVAERHAWLDTSLHPRDAQARLGWSRGEFGKAVAERGIAAGRLGRYARADIDALAGDEDLAEEVRGSRLLGPDQAAEHLEIRRRDFDYCLAAGWITPASYAQTRISRRRVLDVPLYRVAEVDAVGDVPGVDWEAVRATRPGEPSPLREFATLPTGRAALVRGFAADLGQQYGIEVTATYDQDRDRWELRWTPNPASEPAPEAVRSAITRDRGLKPHSRAIVLATTEPPEPDGGR